MAKVTLTFEDTADGAEIRFRSEPHLDLDAKLTNLTVAQALAIEAVELLGANAQALADEAPVGADIAIKSRH